MKLRVRSMDSSETFKIEIPDPSSLQDLKTLIESKISSSSSSSSAISPQSVLRLSLNKKDELVSSPHESLQFLGLTSGDLVFYTLNPNGLSPSGTLTLTVAQNSTAQTLTPPPQKRSYETLTQDSDPVQEVPILKEEVSLISPRDVMEIDVKSHAMEKSNFTVPCFLKKVMEEQNGEVMGDLGRLVIAVHAVFLESGFVLCNGEKSCFPEGWSSAGNMVSVQYTVPGLVGSVLGVDSVILKVQVMGNHVLLYGFSSGDRPDAYRLHLDLHELTPSLISCIIAMSGKDEEKILELWKIVKDKLSWPLLIDLCFKNGLPLPPCLSALPSELKIRILEFLPGIDVARFGCTTSELRSLSLSDELWKRKFEEEFGLLDERRGVTESWKAEFARCLMLKRNANRRTERLNWIRAPAIYAPRGNPFDSNRFPMIGGDYDRFPVIGDRVPSRSRPGFAQFPAQRNFAPRCNFSSHIDNFGG